VFADRLFSLHDLRESSARRIQAAWRGYRVRRKFAEMQDELKREKVQDTDEIIVCDMTLEIFEKMTLCGLGRNVFITAVKSTNLV
jgi:hypothetical protein